MLIDVDSVTAVTVMLIYWRIHHTDSDELVNLFESFSKVTSSFVLQFDTEYAVFFSLKSEYKKNWFVCCWIILLVPYELCDLWWLLLIGL